MSVLSRHSPTRERMYQELLRTPDALWTVRSLWTAIGCRQVSADMVRPNLYLLHHARAVVEVPGHRAWTVRLTKAGADRLSRIVASWRLPDPTCPPTSPTTGAS